MTQTPKPTKIPFRNSPIRVTTEKKIEQNINMSEFFLGAQSMLPTPPTLKKGRKSSNEASNEEKRKLELLERLEKDPKCWSDEAKTANLAMQFGTRCKEIRLKELLHIHYVLNKRSELELSACLPRQVELKHLVTHHFHTCKQLLKKVDTSIIDYALRKVKKIYPYTSPSRTVLKILHNCLPNMACPITRHLSCKEYSLKVLRHQESLNVRHYE
jgi:hypothetical protein